MKKPSRILESGELQWIQGSLFHYNSEGQIIGCCLLGAVVYVRDYMNLTLTEQREIDVKFNELKWDMAKNAGSLRAVSTWNDHPLRARQEVIEKLKEYDL